MKFNFHKYHGTGNDFIMIDNRDGRFKPETGTIATLCHRRFGIGADGLILLENHEGYDFAMKYYNSDGNESTMCGNGGRCITAFADFLSLHGTSYRFRASDGDHQGIILERGIDNCIVKLHMNDVPGYRRWGKDYILDTGSPHLVRFEDHVRSLNVRVEGRQIRHLSDFQPAGINVNFVEDKGDYLFVRTYERGVEDETLSCGTGVTASALAFAASGRTSEGKVRIETSGGILYVHYSRNGEGFTGIWLEGPAVRVFDGVFEI